jgi:hypothetical protein
MGAHTKNCFSAMGSHFSGIVAECFLKVASLWRHDKWDGLMTSREGLVSGPRQTQREQPFIGICTFFNEENEFAVSSFPCSEISELQAPCHTGQAIR